MYIILLTYNIYLDTLSKSNNILLNGLYLK